METMDGPSRRDDDPHMTPSVSSIESDVIIETRCRPQYRWVFSILASFGFVIVYGLRVCLSVTIVPMSHQFHWDESAQGIVLSSFFVGYLLTQIPGGLLAEKRGGKGVYGSGIFFTCLFTILTPASAKLNFTALIVCRIMTGLAEGVTFPAMHAMLSRWAPLNERTKMGGVIYAGANLGTVISMPISALISVKFGWEVVFYSFGIFGLVWCFLWAVFAASEPSTSQWVSEREISYIQESLSEHVGPLNNSPKLPLLKILTNLPFWTIFITHMANNFGFYTLLIEMPTYMENILKFNLKENGFLSALPYLLSFLVSITASNIADLIIFKGLASVTVVRKTFNSIGFMVPSLSLMILALSDQNKDKVLTIALLCLSVGFGGFTNAGFIVNHIDIAPNFAGTLMGFTNTAANAMGILAPYVVSAIINHHDDATHWKIVFIISSLVYFAGNVFYVLFGSSEEQEFNRIHDDELLDNLIPEGVEVVVTEDSEDDGPGPDLGN